MKTLYKPIIQWAARQTLVGRNRRRDRPAKGRFSRADVDQILRRTWRNFDRLAPRVPQEATLGNRMNMLLACVTLSLFESLVDAGLERDYAIELLSDTAWRVYEKWGVVPSFLAGVLTRDPVKRMRMCVNMFLSFPFNAPGYVWARLPAEDGIAFDMLRCPAALHFRANNAGDVCFGSWCNLDYALAEMWAGKLHGQPADRSA